MKSNDPAFPTTIEVIDGMTLRDYFAAHAKLASSYPVGFIQDVLEYPCTKDLSFEDKILFAARMKYAFADAMMKVRKENPDEKASS